MIGQTTVLHTVCCVNPPFPTPSLPGKEYCHLVSHSIEMQMLSLVQCDMLASTDPLPPLSIRCSMLYVLLLLILLD